MGKKNLKIHFWFTFFYESMKTINCLHLLTCLNTQSCHRSVKPTIAVSVCI